MPFSDYTPEYPSQPEKDAPLPLSSTLTELPTPTPYVPHPDYHSKAYEKTHYKVQTCFLDPEEKIPVPDLYAYNGLVQGQPEAAIGSHKLLGIRDDVCFDRFGRYGPYGLGYSLEEGGVQQGMDTENAGNEAIWAKTGKIDYSKVDWGDAQERCFEANRERFSEPADDQSLSTVAALQNAGSSQKKARATTATEVQKQKKDRIAVVIRSYVGFKWTGHAILNFRAMISELALRSGGEYTVHFLLHVRDNKIPIWADAATAQRVLDDNVPAEFHNLCTLWSETQMQLLYPGEFGPTVHNPSRAGIHGVYRSAHMPLQHFALTHPEYQHFWNWEMDMRWLGNYYELFDRLASWAKNQSRVEIWNRNAKYYIPHYHGSWENFTNLVHEEAEASGQRPFLGPADFPGRLPTRHEELGYSYLPEECGQDSTSVSGSCGVGEEADLITLNPLFDTQESGWVFSRDVTGYDKDLPIPPRRSAIITASRLSRRLLAVMHEETWRRHHGMFSEMFPPSMALHHGLKATFAPHPIFLDREWELEAIEKNYNGGQFGSTNGRGSPFDLGNEHNHKGASWYYNAEFAGLLWRRWLGYAQKDGRGNDGGRAGEGAIRGGREEEESPYGTGRLCLRSMLVHPIKHENPAERR